MIAALADSADEAQFGGKAAQLARALGGGLRVPHGFALSWRALDAIASGDARLREEAAARWSVLGGATAVRSSAVGEDSVSASFAGQHATVLNVRTRDGFFEAVAQVWASARSESALAYRRNLGLDATPRIGAVVQRLVPAEVAGVLFTVNPSTGADERVIEASWGLGEAVVAGRVSPDLFRVARGGRVLEVVAGLKDVAVLPCERGGTEEAAVEPERVDAPCLDDAALAQLDALATRCETLFGGAQDLEFALASGELHLLQRRPITGRRR